MCCHVDPFHVTLRCVFHFFPPTKVRTMPGPKQHSHASRASASHLRDIHSPPPVLSFSLCAHTHASLFLFLDFDLDAHALALDFDLDLDAHTLALALALALALDLDPRPSTLTLTPAPTFSSHWVT